MGRVLMQMEIYEWGRGISNPQPNHVPNFTPTDPLSRYLVFFFILSSFPCYEDHGVVCYMDSERCRQD